MELFATDRDRLAFLLETDAALDLDFETLEALAGEVPEEQPPEKRPKYITNYIGSKQKLVDWIWKHTPDGVDSVVDAFSGSAVVAYMYKTKGLRVLANDRLHYCHHDPQLLVTCTDFAIPSLAVKHRSPGPASPVHESTTRSVPGDFLLTSQMPGFNLSYVYVMELNDVP